MIDPLAGMLWLTAASALLVAVYFAKTQVLGAKAPGAQKAVGTGAGSFGVGSAGVAQAFEEKVEAVRRTAGSLAVGVLMLGVFAFIMATWMNTTWPIVGSYNILFGEIYAGYGIVLIVGSLSYLLGYDLKAASYLAAILGIWGLTDAYGILVNSMTNEPLVSAAMYVFGSLAGLLSPIATHRPGRLVATAIVVFLVLFAFIAGFIGFEASLHHLTAFAKYTP